MQIDAQWKLLAGLRWDRFSGRFTSPVTGSAAATERSRSDGLWSRRLGVLYQPSAFASWHLSYGTSFNTSGDPYQYDALGSNTPPEGSVNYELGGKFDLMDGNLSLRLALFKSIKTNERNRDETSVTATNYVLSGTSLQGEAVGSRQGLGAGLNARSSMAPQLVTTFEAPSYVTADLMAEYSVGEYSVGEISYKANLSNVTNKLYADMLYRGHYTPGKGRTLQLTGSFRF